MNGGQCQKCRTFISTDASKCPGCGYEPSSDGRTARTIALFAGIGLTLTGIGAIIGLPLLALVAYGETKAKNMRPTV